LLLYSVETGWILLNLLCEKQKLLCKQDGYYLAYCVVVLIVLIKAKMAENFVEECCFLFTVSFLPSGGQQWLYRKCYVSSKKKIVALQSVKM
jgi:hypothetical protein